jgi:hypothetical protein
MLLELLAVLWLLMLLGVGLASYAFGWWWRGEHERKLRAERAERERRFQETMAERKALEREVNRQLGQPQPRLYVVK